MQLLCSAKMSLDHFMDNNSQSFIHIKYSEKNIVCFHLHLFIYEILINFVELNFKLTQYCMVSWYYLVSWYFSWYSIVRHFYGIVTTLLTRITHCGDISCRLTGWHCVHWTLVTCETLYVTQPNTQNTQRKYCINVIYCYYDVKVL